MLMKFSVNGPPAIQKSLYKRLIFECRFHTLNHNHSSEFLKDLLTPKVSNQTSKMYESLPFIQNVHSS